MAHDQKRFFLAIALSGLVLVLWQVYFVAPFDQPAMDPAPTVVDRTQTDESIVADVSHDEGERKDDVEVSSHSLSIDGHRFFFLNNLTVQNIFNETAVFDFQSIAGAVNPFHVEILTTTGSERLLFDLVSDGSTRRLTGFNQTYNVNFSATLDDMGRLDFHLRSPVPLRYRFVFTSSEGEAEGRQAREFITYTNSISRSKAGKSSSGDGFLQWFGIDFNYHLFAFVFPERQRSAFEMTRDGRFVIDMLDGVQDFHGELVFTKKNYDVLSNLGNNLHLSVDFGFFGILAVPILRGLEMFYGLIPNYGLAIILLTILIRMITFPLQFKSFQSMKKMQKIQPELQKIREKHKEDPQRLQKETMELFKRAGANPLGGCLPLLAQMPIFFAFYQVLYNAVELVGSPFIFWLTDLSVKDPFYVLPILMGGSLFLQMKLNPTPATDPMQKKIMMFMPVIFSFIMFNLPSGLNLYILVSTLFGIVQQLIVYRMTD
jgi:YidC/Oxa1 family membrane protein insertase